MKFGIFFEISVPRPWDADAEKTVYDRCIEQTVVADQAGFDYVWAVEHHFLEEYSHCSAPEVFLTACAVKTERIRIGQGIAVCVPEINHPVRVAERAAVMDIISGGRYDFGTGRSATWTELGGFRADPDTTKATWDEFVSTRRQGARQGDQVQLLRDRANLTVRIQTLPTLPSHMHRNFELAQYLPQRAHAVLRERFSALQPGQVLSSVITQAG